MLRLLAAAHAAALALLIVPVASADPPTRSTFPTPEPFVVEGFCTFPVKFEFLVNQEVLKTFADGSLLVTGRLVVRLTNAANPANTIVVNASGPGRSNPDGSFTGGGRGLFTVPAEFSPTGESFIALTFGPTLVVLDSSGVFQPVELSNHVVDVCQLLA